MALANRLLTIGAIIAGAAVMFFTYNTIAHLLGFELITADRCVASLALMQVLWPIPGPLLEDRK